MDWVAPGDPGFLRKMTMLLFGVLLLFFWIFLKLHFFFRQHHVDQADFELNI